MAIQQFGVPTAAEVFCYVGGALLGFAALTAFAFSRLFDAVDRDGSGDIVAVSMVHSIATVGNLLVSYLLVVVADAVRVPAVGVFLVVEVQMTVGYNGLLLLEGRVARTIAAVEG